LPGVTFLSTVAMVLWVLRLLCCCNYRGSTQVVDRGCRAAGEAVGQPLVRASTLFLFADSQSVRSSMSFVLG